PCSSRGRSSRRVASASGGGPPCGSGSPARTASTRTSTWSTSSAAGGRSRPASCRKPRTESNLVASGGDAARRKPHARHAQELERRLEVDVVAADRVPGTEVDRAVHLGDDEGGRGRQQVDTDEVASDR